MIGEVCPECGLTYQDFRTGLTYSEVWLQFWSGDPDPSTWRNKRRHTVLGRWHQIKEDMWKEHLWMCEQQAQWEATHSATDDGDDDVPF